MKPQQYKVFAYSTSEAAHADVLEKSINDELDSASKDGYVVINHMVVQEAKKIVIIMAKDRE